MNTDLLQFNRVTGLGEQQAGITESLLAGICREGWSGRVGSMQALVDKAVGAWKSMGQGGRIVAGEGASILAAAGLVDAAEHILAGTGTSPIKVEALMNISKTVLGFKHYGNDQSCGIVDLMLKAQDMARFGAGGRAGVLERLVSGRSDWPLGIDGVMGASDLKTYSCVRAIDLYWAGHSGAYGKKTMDAASRQEVLDFSKALARQGSDPVGGHTSALAAAIPPWSVMGAAPDMWLLEQVAGLGWIDDRACEQAWATAVREDVDKHYLKHQKLGKRAQGLQKAGIGIRVLSASCPRRFSLKMAALDRACTPMLRLIADRGIDVDWRGENGQGGFFDRVMGHHPELLVRTLEAARGLALPFTEQHLRVQCAGPNPEAVRYMLKADPGITGRAAGSHFLGGITAYADNAKNHRNIGAVIDLFAQNARENECIIPVDEATLNCVIRAGTIEKMIQNMDCFSFDPKIAPALIKKICLHRVEWDAGRSQATQELVARMIQSGASIPGEARQSGALVARAMQSRNPGLAMFLLDHGAKVNGMDVGQFLPKSINKDDGQHHAAMIQALACLARHGVEMVQVGGGQAQWANPLIAAAGRARLDEVVEEADTRQPTRRIGLRF